MNPETPVPDPVFSRVCEVSARLMGGAVHRSAMKELQKLVAGNPGSYPWEAVLERVLAQPAEVQALTKSALQSQRDWIVRGGRQTPGKGLRRQAKSFLAVLMARLIFMAILLPCLVVLLTLLKLRWPEFDIYFANDWLAATWPGVFGPR